MVAALMTASTCGSSRMTFMRRQLWLGIIFSTKLTYTAAATADEDDEHDPVASLHIWVRIWHVEIIGRRRFQLHVRKTAGEAARFKRVPAA